MIKIDPAVDVSSLTELWLSEGAVAPVCELPSLVHLTLYKGAVAPTCEMPSLTELWLGDRRFTLASGGSQND